MNTKEWKKSSLSFAVKSDGTVSLKEELRELENHLINMALTKSDNNISKAAKLLNINRTTLVMKMKNMLSNVYIKNSKKVGPNAF